MCKLLKNFSFYIKEKNILIALSGGVDSIVLLHQLIIYKEKKKKINIRAIHINHNSHKNSQKMQDLCQKICKTYNITLIIKQIKKIDTKKYGLEASFRKERYKIYKKILFTKEILLTAHHLNDQFENFFLSLKRKYGISGLSGIKQINYIQNIKIYRPLLLCTKQEILLWAKKNNILWIEDPTNSNIKFDRNYLRIKILPIFLEKWPYFFQNCIYTMKIVSEEKKIIDYFIYKFLKKNMYIDGRLSLQKFKNIPKNLHKILFKHWIFKKINIMPSFGIIMAVNKLYQLNEKKYEKKIIFQTYEIFIYQNNMYIMKLLKEIKKKKFLWEDIHKPFKLPNQLGYLIASHNPNDGVKLPTPDPNIAINIQFNVKKLNIVSVNLNKKKIKNLWQTNKVPPYWRANIPLLFYNEYLISAIGIFTNKLKLQKNKNYIFISWINFI